MSRTLTEYAGEMIARVPGLVGVVAEALVELLGWFGFESLAERFERKNEPDPRNFPPPR